ncbi:hypothetical protein KI387_034934, partial [Taxus chinensis]
GGVTQIWCLQSGNIIVDDVKNLRSNIWQRDFFLQGYVGMKVWVSVDPLNSTKEEVLDIVTPCIWLERNLMEDCFEFIMHSNKIVKDSTLHGQGVSVLIDNRATYNFIDESLTAKMDLKVEDFKGFTVKVADDYSIPCTRRSP